MYRKDVLTTGEYYHVYNKSIAGYVIFNHAEDYERMRQMIFYYHQNAASAPFSKFKRDRLKGEEDPIAQIRNTHNGQGFVTVVAYCLMPTHFHLVLRQNVDRGIERYMHRIESGYATFFNLKYRRNGPLWMGRFKNVHVNDDEHMAHLIRYVHLNPSTAGLVKNPKKWKYSSYLEYLGIEKCPICNFKEVSNMRPKEYKSFIEGYKDVQIDLAVMKKHHMKEIVR